VLACALAVPAAAHAQAVPASSLKAAFLLNFAKFAEWPALERDAPITLCVAADDVLADALDSTVKGQTIDAHPIRVVRLEDDGAGRGCQLLFIGVRDSSRVTVWLEQATAKPILTVSDTEGFATAGGAIEFFVEAGRMRFAVNVDAAQRSRVRLSSRLLGLAKIVRDSHAP
jgi:hypothetical protein